MSRRIFLVSLLSLLASNVHASCGAAFCTLNTSWETQGVSTEPGLRVDLRYEYVNQDQPRAGRDKVSVGEIRQHHDEQRTLNRNVIGTIDYAPSARDGVSIQLPFVRRDHSHIHNHHGALIHDSWQFEGLGDIKIIGRRRLGDGDSRSGVLYGVKLATGSTTRSNDDGDPAERSLQAGSGTTDAVMGFYTSSLSLWGETPVRVFVQGQVQAPTNARGGFRPGAQYSADVGIAYPAAGTWSGLLQLNASIKDRDRGWEAEPANSGGSFLWLSPGLSFALSRDVQWYGFVQLPAYQRVNGVQLTASTSVATGVHWRF